MDRFIVSHLKFCDIRVIYLKSNMDRFIGSLKSKPCRLLQEFKIQYGQIYRCLAPVVVCLRINLKSNMDRFIGHFVDKNFRSLSLFKIQYGQIYRFLHFIGAGGLSLFKIQYGQIYRTQRKTKAKCICNLKSNMDRFIGSVLG